MTDSAKENARTSRFSRFLKWLHCDFGEHTFIKTTVEETHGHLKVVRKHCYVCEKDLGTDVEP